MSVQLFEVDTLGTAKVRWPAARSANDRHCRGSHIGSLTRSSTRCAKTSITARFRATRRTESTEARYKAETGMAIRFFLDREARLRDRA